MQNARCKNNFQDPTFSKSLFYCNTQKTMELIMDNEAKVDIVELINMGAEQHHQELFHFSDIQEVLEEQEKFYFLFTVNLHPTVKLIPLCCLHSDQHAQFAHSAY